MEEERARQEAAANKPAEGEGSGAAEAVEGTAAEEPKAEGVTDMEADDDALLQQGLAMSVNAEQGATEQPAGDVAMDEGADADLALALQVSQHKHAPSRKYCDISWWSVPSSFRC